MQEPEDLLTRLARSDYFVAKASTAKTEVNPEVRARQQRLVRTIRLLDVAALLFWVYAIVKVFVFDVDRAVVGAIYPPAVSFLDYRVFLYLGLLIALFVFWRRLWWITLYIAFFPVLVLVWKLPWFFLKRKSWPLTFAALQTIFSAVGQFRYHLIHKTLWLLGAVLVLVVDGDVVLIGAAAMLISLLLVALYRAVRKSFEPSSFIELQRKGIRGLLNAGPFRDFLKLKDEYKQLGPEPYTQAAAIEVSNTISYGVIATRGLYLWAYQLQRYRTRYSPSLVFSALSFGWLFLGTVLTFALANWATYRANPDQFLLAGEPSLLGMIVYALSSLALSEGGGIQAVGEVALVWRLLAGFTGPVFLLTVFINVVLTIRRERDETAIAELVNELKDHGRSQEEWFEREYAISVDEAQVRLMAIGAGFATIFRYIAEAMPSDFYREGSGPAHTKP